jgi:protein-L-isoaspartate(D-aspartate) O-methyltransferase
MQKTIARHAQRTTHYALRRAFTLLRRVVSIAVLVTFLATNTGFAAEELGNLHLAPALRFGSLGDEHQKNIVLAKMALSGFLKLLDDARDIDGAVTVEQVLKAFRKREDFVGPNFTKFPTGSGSSGDGVKAFFESVEPVTGNIFAVPVAVTRGGSRHDYKLLFSTLRDHSGQFPVEFCTPEQVKAAAAEMAKHNAIPKHRERDALAMARYKNNNEMIIDPWIAERMKAGDYMRMEDVPAPARNKMFGNMRKFLADAEIRFDRDPLGTRPIFLVRVPKGSKNPVITEKDSETGEDVAITVVSHSSNNATYIFLRNDLFDNLKSGIRDEFTCSSIEIHLIHEIGVMFGVHGWISKHSGIGNVLSEMYKLHWHRNLKVPLNELWKVKGYPGLGAVLKPIDLDENLATRDYAGGKDVVGPSNTVAGEITDRDRVRQFARAALMELSAVKRLLRKMDALCKDGKTDEALELVEDVRAALHYLYTANEKYIMPGLSNINADYRDWRGLFGKHLYRSAVFPIGGDIIFFERDKDPKSLRKASAHIARLSRECAALLVVAERGELAVISKYNEAPYQNSLYRGLRAAGLDVPALKNQLIRMDGRFAGTPELYRAVVEFDIDVSGAEVMKQWRAACPWNAALLMVKLQLNRSGLFSEKCLVFDMSKPDGQRLIYSSDYQAVRYGSGPEFDEKTRSLVFRSYTDEGRKTFIDRHLMNLEERRPAPKPDLSAEAQGGKQGIAKADEQSVEGHGLAPFEGDIMKIERSSAGHTVVTNGKKRIWIYDPMGGLIWGAIPAPHGYRMNSQIVVVPDSNRALTARDLRMRRVAGLTIQVQDDAYDLSGVNLIVRSQPSHTAIKSFRTGRALPGCEKIDASKGVKFSRNYIATCDRIGYLTLRDANSGSSMLHGLGKINAVNGFDITDAHAAVLDTNRYVTLIDVAKKAIVPGCDRIDADGGFALTTEYLATVDRHGLLTIRGVRTGVPLAAFNGVKAPASFRLASTRIAMRDLQNIVKVAELSTGDAVPGLEKVPNAIDYELTDLYLGVRDSAGYATAWDLGTGQIAEGCATVKSTAGFAVTDDYFLARDHMKPPVVRELRGGSLVTPDGLHDFLVSISSKRSASRPADHSGAIKDVWKRMADVGYFPFNDTADKVFDEVLDLARKTGFDIHRLDTASLYVVLASYIFGKFDPSQCISFFETVRNSRAKDRRFYDRIMKDPSLLKLYIIARLMDKGSVDALRSVKEWFPNHYLDGLLGGHRAERPKGLDEEALMSGVFTDEVASLVKEAMRHSRRKGNWEAATRLAENLINMSRHSRGLMPSMEEYYDAIINDLMGELLETIRESERDAPAGTIGDRRGPDGRFLDHPGKSPYDIFVIISRFFKPDAILTAPDVFEAYRAHYRELGFEAPSPIRASGIATVRADMFDRSDSLERQGLIRYIFSRGERGELQAVLTERGKLEASRARGRPLKADLGADAASGASMSDLFENVGLRGIFAGRGAKMAVATAVAAVTSTVFLTEASDAQQPGAAGPSGAAQGVGRSAPWQAGMAEGVRSFNATEYRAAYGSLYNVAVDTNVPARQRALALNMMGVSMQRTGKPDLAVICYKSALRLSPEDETISNNFVSALDAAMADKAAREREIGSLGDDPRSAVVRSILSRSAPKADEKDAGDDLRQFLRYMSDPSEKVRAAARSADIASGARRMTDPRNYPKLYAAMKSLSTDKFDIRKPLQALSADKVGMDAIADILSEAGRAGIGLVATFMPETPQEFERVASDADLVLSRDGSGALALAAFGKGDFYVNFNGKEEVKSVLESAGLVKGRGLLLIEHHNAFFARSIGYLNTTYINGRPSVSPAPSGVQWQGYDDPAKPDFGEKKAGGGARYTPLRRTLHSSASPSGGRQGAGRPDISEKYPGQAVRGTVTRRSTVPEPPVAGTENDAPLGDLAPHSMVNVLIQMALTNAVKDRAGRINDPYVYFDETNGVYWFGRDGKGDSTFHDIFIRLAALKAGKDAPDEVDRYTVFGEIVRLAGRIDRRLKVCATMKAMADFEERLKLQVEHFGVEDIPLKKIYAMGRYNRNAEDRERLLGHVGLERSIHRAVINEVFNGYYDDYRQYWRGGFLAGSYLVERDVIAPGEGGEPVVVLKAGRIIPYASFIEEAHRVANGYFPLGLARNEMPARTRLYGQGVESPVAGLAQDEESEGGGRESEGDDGKAEKGAALRREIEEGIIKAIEPVGGRLRSYYDPEVQAAADKIVALDERRRASGISIALEPMTYVIYMMLLVKRNHRYVLDYFEHIQKPAMGAEYDEVVSSGSMLWAYMVAAWMDRAMVEAARDADEIIVHYAMKKLTGDRHALTSLFGPGGIAPAITEIRKAIGYISDCGADEGDFDMAAGLIDNLIVSSETLRKLSVAKGEEAISAMISKDIAECRGVISSLGRRRALLDGYASDSGRAVIGDAKRPYIAACSGLNGLDGNFEVDRHYYRYTVRALAPREGEDERVLILSEDISGYLARSGDRWHFTGLRDAGELPDPGSSAAPKSDKQSVERQPEDPYREGFALGGRKSEGDDGKAEKDAALRREIENGIDTAAAPVIDKMLNFSDPDVQVAAGSIVALDERRRAAGIRIGLKQMTHVIFMRLLAKGDHRYVVKYFNEEIQRPGATAEYDEVTNDASMLWAYLMACLMDRPQVEAASAAGKILVFYAMERLTGNRHSLTRFLGADGIGRALIEMAAIVESLAGWYADKCEFEKAAGLIDNLITSTEAASAIAGREQEDRILQALDTGVSEYRKMELYIIRRMELYRAFSGDRGEAVAGDDKRPYIYGFLASQGLDPDSMENTLYRYTVRRLAPRDGEEERVLVLGEEGSGYLICAGGEWRFEELPGGGGMAKSDAADAESQSAEGDAAAGAEAAALRAEIENGIDGAMAPVAGKIARLFDADVQKAADAIIALDEKRRENNIRVGVRHMEHIIRARLLTKGDYKYALDFFDGIQEPAETDYYDEITSDPETILLYLIAYHMDGARMAVAAREAPKRGQKVIEYALERLTGNGRKLKSLLGEERRRECQSNVYGTLAYLAYGHADMRDFERAVAVIENIITSVSCDKAVGAAMGWDDIINKADGITAHLRNVQLMFNLRKAALERIAGDKGEGVIMETKGPYLARFAEIKGLTVTSSWAERYAVSRLMPEPGDDERLLILSGDAAGYLIRRARAWRFADIRPGAGASTAKADEQSAESEDSVRAGLGASGANDVQGEISALTDTVLNGQVEEDRNRAAESLVRMGKPALDAIIASPQRAAIIFAILGSVVPQVEFGARMQRNINMLITHRCPFGCPFCIARDVMNASPEADFPKEELKKYLLQLDGFPSIYFVGGEPFAYMNTDKKSRRPTEDFWEILKFACDRIKKVHIDTNGFYFPEDEKELEAFLDRIPDNVVILFSLDDYHDRQAELRGMDLKKIIDGCRRYAARKKRLEFRYNVRVKSAPGEHQNESEELKELFGKYGLSDECARHPDRFYIDHILAQGGAARNLDDSVYARRFRQADMEGHRHPGNLFLFNAVDGRLLTCDHAAFMNDPPGSTVLGNVMKEDLFTIMTRWGLEEFGGGAVMYFLRDIYAALRPRPPFTPVLDLTTKEPVTAADERSAQRTEKRIARFVKGLSEIKVAATRLIEKLESGIADQDGPAADILDKRITAIMPHPVFSAMVSAQSVRGAISIYLGTIKKYLTGESGEGAGYHELTQALAGYKMVMTDLYRDTQDAAGKEMIVGLYQDMQAVIAYLGIHSSVNAIIENRQYFQGENFDIDLISFVSNPSIDKDVRCAAARGAFLIRYTTAGLCALFTREVTAELGLDKALDTLDKAVRAFSTLNTADKYAMATLDLLMRFNELDLVEDARGYYYILRSFQRLGIFDTRILNQNIWLRDEVRDTLIRFMRQETDLGTVITLTDILIAIDSDAALYLLEKNDIPELAYPLYIAFDRHVKWIKDRPELISGSPRVSEALERMEAAMRSHAALGWQIGDRDGASKYAKDSMHERLCETLDENAVKLEEEATFYRKAPGREGQYEMIRASIMRVTDVMKRSPRYIFLPQFVKPWACRDTALPLPLGHDQTISQPSVVQHMTSLLNPKEGEKALEIGTGSGYQAFILSQLVGDKGEVHTIDVYPDLVEKAKSTCGKLGAGNIRFYSGDGSAGLKDKGPFDMIMVTAGAPAVPEALRQQLNRNGGRLLIPVLKENEHNSYEVTLIIRQGDDFKEFRLLDTVWVPLVGEFGHQGVAIDKDAASLGAPVLTEEHKREAPKSDEQSAEQSEEFNQVIALQMMDEGRFKEVIEALAKLAVARRGQEIYVICQALRQHEEKMSLMDTLDGMRLVTSARRLRDDYHRIELDVLDLIRDLLLGYDPSMIKSVNEEVAALKEEMARQFRQATSIETTAAEVRDAPALPAAVTDAVRRTQNAVRSTTPDLLGEAISLLPTEWLEQGLDFNDFAWSLVGLTGQSLSLDRKAAMIFSEKVTFDSGLGILLPKLAHSGRKIIVIATNAKERGLIDRLNEGRPMDERIAVAESVADARSRIQAGRYYYFKVKGDPEAGDLAGVTTCDITALVERIIRILGRVTGIAEGTQAASDLYRATQKFIAAAA